MPPRIFKSPLNAEAVKLDPLPYADDEMPTLRLPVGNIGFSTFTPRPGYSQNESDYTKPSEKGESA